MKGVVDDRKLLHSTEEDSSAAFVATKILSDQREFVEKIKDLAEIEIRLTGAWKEDEDIAKTLGSSRQVADLHGDLLNMMERNLSIRPFERRWAPVFEAYLENIEMETIFVMNELSAKAKIQSLIHSTKCSYGDPTKSLLTRGLSILPLVPDRVSIYTNYLKRARLDVVSTATI